jgi:DNA (cytosine-5)-methyltransferase 1
MGCRVAAGIFSAAEVGGSHRRERLFVMADRAGAGRRQPGSGPEPLGRSETARGIQPRRQSSGMADSGGGGTWRGEPLAVAGSRGAPEHIEGGGSVGHAEHDGCGGQVIHAGPRGEGRGTPCADGTGRGIRGVGLADARGARPQGRQRGGASGERHGPAASRPTPEFRLPLFAPGPSDPAWAGIIDADPLLVPAIGNLDIWAIARGNLGIPPLGDAVGRRGGMARDLGPEATAILKSEVRRISHVLAHRVDRLRACDNGVYSLAGAYAWRSLDARLRAGA